MRAGVVFAAAAPAGSPAFVSAGDFVLGTDVVGRPGVASGPTGEFLVAWSSSYNGYGNSLFARGYGADGVPIGSPFIVMGYQAPLCPSYYDPVVARFPDGSYVAAAFEFDDPGPGCIVPDGPPGGLCSIALRTFSSDGSIGSVAAFGGSPCYVGGPSVATQPDGSFVLVYHDFSPPDNGVIRGVRAPAANLPPVLGSGINASVATGPAGEIGVTWVSLAPTTPNAIVLRLFAFDGTPLGPEQVVNQVGQGAEPAVAYGAGASVFVVWTGPGSGDDNSAGAVQGRLTDANGTPLGPQFQVNTLTAGDQSHARVSALPDGGFLVAWESQASAGADQEGYSIQVRHYLADGTPDGPEQQMNVVASGDQSLPDIAAAAQDRPAIVWNNHNAEVRAFSDRVDLGIAITDGAVTTVPGATLTYVAPVTNAGVMDVTGAPVSVVFPGALSCTWTCSGTGGASCAGGTHAGDVVDVASVPVGGMATYQAACVVGQQAAGTLVVSASVNAPPGDTDVNPANNTATDTTDVVGIVIDDVAVEEGDAGTNLAGVAVRLLSPMATPVTVDFGTSDGTATSGSDYLPASGTLSFAPGETLKSVDVSVLGDTIFEVDETFFVTLSNATGAIIVDGQGLGTILNDDSALPSGSLDELVHGSSEVRSLESAPGPAAVAQYWSLQQQPLSSYEVVVDATSGDLGPQGPALERVASDGTIVQHAIGTGAARRLRWESAGSVSDQSIRVQSRGCIDDCDAADVFRVRMWETTAFGSRFNNSATQITVLLLQNGGADPIAGNVHFMDSAGTLLLSQPFTVPARGTQG